MFRRIGRGLKGVWDDADNEFKSNVLFGSITLVFAVSIIVMFTYPIIATILTATILIGSFIILCARFAKFIIKVWKRGSEDVQ